MGMREKLIELLEEAGDKSLHQHIPLTSSMIADHLIANGVVVANFETTTNADLVEVVRCEKCRFCKKHPTYDKVKMCTNEQWNTEYHPLVHDDDFCSYGERRSE